MGKSKAGIDYLRDEHRRITSSVVGYIERHRGRPRARYRLNGEKILYLAHQDANQIIRDWPIEEARADILTWEITYGEATTYQRKPPSKLKYEAKQQNRLTKIEDRTYYADKHRNNPGCIVQNSWPRNDGPRTNVLYRLRGDRKIFKSPRNLTRWLDGLHIDKIKEELELWTRRENGWDNSLEQALSQTYLEHRVRFLRWLSAGGKTKSGTLANYEAHLARYIFPYFRKYRLKENQWGENLGKWSAWLATHPLETETRNRIRTAMRRWLKYGIHFGLWNTVVPTDERSNKSRDKRPIPFDYLPTHKEVIQILQSLDPSRERWILTMVAGFGVRVSEALSMTNANIIGKSQLATDASSATFAANYAKKYANTANKPMLMMDVNERVQDGDDEIIRIVKQEDDIEPKSGPYVAVCTDLDTARFIQTLVKGREFDLQLSGSLYDIFDSLSDGYDEWRYHHFRKWHETWLGLGWGEEDAARCHGHSRIVSTKHYIQWALTRLRGSDEDVELLFDPA